MITVHPGVFVPRAQTEELARRAAALVPPAGRAVDLCTGCGAVGVHLLATVPDSAVVGVDVDARAAACARDNGIAAVVADIDRVPLRPRSFDVVVAVAPYVPTGDLRLLPTDVQRHEPRRALDGGDDGLEVVRRVVTAAARLLRPGGSLLVEVGGRQDALLGPDLAAAGFERGRPWYDEDGDLRGLAARRRTQLPL
jgi:release factor glutamine methyltransferase